MTHYPATIISLDDEHATARIEATGQVIKFPHGEPNAVPAPLRAVGTKGAISFPKAPPYFGEVVA